jgi:hypothetical protein
MVNKASRQKRVSKYTDEQAKVALHKTDGNQSEAAKLLGVSRVALNKRINTRPELKQVVIDLIEVRLDRYEKALDDLRDAKNSTAVIFYLKTLGRHRGYVEHAPLEEMNTAKLNAYKEMFAAIGGRPRNAVHELKEKAIAALDQESDSQGSESRPESRPEAQPAVDLPPHLSLKPALTLLEAKLNVQASPDSLPAKTFHRNSNFP